MSRLQNEVGTKDFFPSHESSHEKCAESFVSEFFEPLFVGQKKSRKIPAKFPSPISPPQNVRKQIHRRASAGSPGEYVPTPPPPPPQLSRPCHSLRRNWHRSRFNPNLLLGPFLLLDLVGFLQQSEKSSRKAPSRTIHTRLLHCHANEPPFVLPNTKNRGGAKGKGKQATEVFLMACP